MENFDYYNPVRISFGVGSTDEIGKVTREYGTTALVVSYKNAPYMKNLTDTILLALKEAGIKTATCFNVSANPLLSQVREGIEICRHEGVDVLIGVGGGSVMDTAKTIGVGALYDGDVWNMFCCGRREPVVPSKSLPTIMVPTLPATSSEMNNIAVVTNDETMEKSHICHKLLYPKVSLMDPALTCTLPPYQTACGGVDAISHVMESYFNAAPNTPFQDRLQEGTIQSIMELLPKVLDNPFDASLRASIQWASTLAWNGWIQAGVSPRSPMHAIGHVLSARYGVTHGATLGIVMPAFFKYVYKCRVSRFCQFAARVLNMEASETEATAFAAIEKFEAFIDSVGVQTRLGQVGVDASQFELIASDAIKLNGDKSGFLPSDPPLDKTDIKNVLMLAL